MESLRTAFPIAALLACVLWPATAEATWPGKPGLVAYSDYQGIHTVRSDGTHHRLISPGVGGGGGFDWSPNGRELAVSGGFVARMRADGSQERVVVDSGYHEPDRSTYTMLPAWGPKGDKLVFTASSTWSDPDKETEPWQLDWIWSVDRDGSDLRKLVRGNEAVWSGDGGHILFIDEDYDIVEANADGSGLRVLARNSVYTHSLDLAPGGNRLVYITDNFKPHGRIFRTLNLGNGARTKFSLRSVSDAVWAPRGKRLAYIFTPPKGRRDELRTIRPDGRGIRTVFRFPKGDRPSSLAWQTR